MPTTPNQPTLPAESQFSESELNFIDESPPHLFAGNQNSNIGIIRKVLSDQVEVVKAQLSLIYYERFIQSADKFLSDWEEAVGLPIAPTGFTVQQRRTRVAARLKTGPFTRKRRQDVIEAYLVSTFGETTQLTTAGAILDATGLPLYSEATSLTGLYTVTEDITNFSYTVNINSSSQIDQAGLLRELSLITPAGINFQVVYLTGPPQPFVYPKSGGGRAIASSNGTRFARRLKSGGGQAIASGSGTRSALVRKAVVTWADVELPSAGTTTTRKAIVTWAELDTP